MRRKLLPDWENDDPQKTDILIKLLTLKPEEAYALNEQLMKVLIKGYDVTELQQKKLPSKYKKKLRVLEKAFDYDGQISHSKSKSYWLATKVGRNTCTYCNRNYIFTIDGNNDKERITRPAFDHWFPKSLFPLLSLNIYNLIPCCTICNSGAKGNMIFHLDTHIHPYMETEDDPKFKFIPQIPDSKIGEWSVVLARDANKYTKVDKTIRAFCLDEIYAMHGNHEVKDIIQFAQAYNNTYLNTIFKIMKNDLKVKGYSKEDVYRMLFNTELLESQFLDRPLSKLKHDILEYLYII
jgi:hypothetical protein